MKLPAVVIAAALLAAYCSVGCRCCATLNSLPFSLLGLAHLQRLEERSTRIYRTDQDGAVRVLTDDKTLQVSCFIDCSNRAALSAKTQPPNGQQADH